MSGAAPGERPTAAGKVVTIHQPDFMPWLGFFHRWARADLYLVLDDVQFLRRGWHHRDKIKTAQGPAWLTVPVRKKGKYDQLINQVQIDPSRGWPASHLDAIRAHYGKAPFFEAVFADLQEIYHQGHENLLELNLAFLRLFARRLEIGTPLALASRHNFSSSKNQRLLDLMEANQGRIYLTGGGSRAYLQEELFRARGFVVQWQQYQAIPYPQLHGGFEPHLSALDALMMVERPADLLPWP